MKLDVANLRYFSKDDFRVLNALELGMRNHDLVPTELIAVIAGLRHGGSHKVLGNLLRNKLLHHERRLYDGYRLTYPGYDYLALRALMQRGAISGVGRQIGVGKESDVFAVTNDAGDKLVLKLQRLGRTSFRAIKRKRDYLKHRKSANWLYMSRLAALKEYAFMRALYDAGFPTPTPIDCNRHALVMSLVDGYPLAQVRELPDPGRVFDDLMQLLLRLGACGLVHGDFNEFNLLIHPETAAVTMIDFPQMVSTSHPNAEEMFDRDVECLRVFFLRRFGFHAADVPKFSSIGPKVMNLDVAIEASGFSADQMKELDDMMAEQTADKAEAADGGDEDESGSEHEGVEDNHVGEIAATAAADADTGGYHTVAADVLAESTEITTEEADAAEASAPAPSAAPSGTAEADAMADARRSESGSDARNSGEDSDEEADDDATAPVPEALLAERPPEGLRARPGGRRVKPRGGEAYLRRDEEKDTGEGEVAGVSASEIRRKVKAGLEKQQRRKAAAASSAAVTANRTKDREKHRAREAAKRGEFTADY